MKTEALLFEFLFLHTGLVVVSSILGKPGPKLHLNTKQTVVVSLQVFQMVTSCVSEYFMPDSEAAWGCSSHSHLFG